MKKTATIRISSLEELTERFNAAVENGKPLHGRNFSYATPELLFRTFTTPRWRIIRVMTGAGPMSIRELARRLERDVKGVHRDVQALLQAGLMENDANGAIVFPYDTVHVNFKLKAADLSPLASERESAAAPVVENRAALPQRPPRTPRTSPAPRVSRKRATSARPAGNR
ncbi:transcriptional regulator [Caballeronia sp. LP006]|uniref:HVO_A0114 family putative DNA-binding protein n=1 Tax=unclassified Caballeronia TaxID=2646786 RepID=UPI0020294A4C|nr:MULTISPECIES: transcriptional regulator [unclassified Caballeronia]MDR5827377.1 transcriptional regulator [Caballeronia sp. LP006]